MLRTIAAVIAGYVVLFLFTAVSFSLFYMATGPAFAYEPGSSVASTGWMSGAIVLSLIAAALGGWTAARIGRSFRPAIGLAALVLVLGLVSAVMLRGVTRNLPEGRTIESLSVMEVAQYTTQPDWYNFAIPFVGVIGVLAGGTLAVRRRTVAAPSVV